MVYHRGTQSTLLPTPPVVVRDNRIVAVGPSGSVSIPANATRIDVSGKTIIPGWIDIHAHMGGASGVHQGEVWSYLINLANGITELLDGYPGHEHNYPVYPLFKDIVELVAKSGITCTPTLLVAYGGRAGRRSPGRTRTGDRGPTPPAFRKRTSQGATVSLNRRDFLATGATAAAGFAVTSPFPVGEPLAPTSWAAGRPIVIASTNGLRGVKVAYDRIAAGEDTLDAIIAGVNIQELDPEDQSVGYGGLPNADGVVQLDASCMHGPTRRAGSVACLEDIATPSLVAKAIMDYTDHIMLVGDDARRFAVDMGFKTQNLLTEKSRQDWLRWKARLNASDYWLDHDDDVKIKFHSGTINMNAVNAAGDISSVTTTSGMSWKIPGRVGDSPIIGAGQYCDNTVGAAGSTGRGEANIKVCGAFLAVEQMRQGKTPEQALMYTMERVVAMTERRLLDDRGRPRFDLSFYAVAKDGTFAGSCAYEGGDFAVCDASGARVQKAVFLYKANERPRR